MILVEQSDLDHALGLARRQGYEHAKREHQQLLGLLIVKAGGSVTLTPLDMQERYEMTRADELDGRVVFTATKDSK